MAITLPSDAPVIARGSVVIDAPPSVVWKTISDIDQWPTWNPDVSSARLDGNLEVGSTFRWKAGPGTITSTLLEVEPGRSIAWRGSTMGIRAVHIWRIEADGNGTRLETEESWDGLIVRLLARSMHARLDTAITRGLEAARSAAESRSDGAGS
jgi:uncharacterized protein YndB with AHSA1/START domain